MLLHMRKQYVQHKGDVFEVPFCMDSKFSLLELYFEHNSLMFSINFDTLTLNDTLIISNTLTMSCCAWLSISSIYERILAVLRLVGKEQEPFFLPILPFV